MWNSLSLLAANEFGSFFRRNVTATIVYGVSLVVGFAGLVFALVAGHSWLSVRMSSIEASLAISGALLVLAVGIACFGYYLKNRRRTNSELASTALIALPIAARLVASRTNWRTFAVAAILAAGVLAGRQLGEKD